MLRKKLLFIAAIVAFSTITIISIINRTYASKEEKILKYEIYIVQQGDTLWKIAKRYTKGDPRELIYEIRELNNITPVIRPGQEIKIPVK